MLLHPITPTVEGPYRARGWRRSLAGGAIILRRIVRRLFVRPM